ncbi:GLPGLI family protein [Elizabethkingia argentiflava]|uniref:GLPGLI family protein n=1 Tax=Elizabethkingia argenteiflava TaxID=2681556 RepID=A0A845PWL6_9FLAO|nr:GLPGLI family protein [Elizabethkingia argenteiflava]NAW51583.1 GLPGLI family protein [Elizabethkingia argenteiflava]
MKKIAFLFIFTWGIIVTAQVAAHRFVYEMTYKPKKGSDSLDRELMVLDISPNKSIYQDYTKVEQDSIYQERFEKMRKSGIFDPDFSKNMKSPKISYVIHKHYPSMKVQYIEMIMSVEKASYISYSEELKFNWKIDSEQTKIGDYRVQKATTEFGGRRWTAWFSTDFPFQDGPYKFNGLPGLIIKIEDEGKNYSWVLQANKKLSDYQEQTYIEKFFIKNAVPKDLPKEKFYKIFNAYKKDPFGALRSYITPEILNRKLPGTNKSFGDMIKDQDKMLRKLYSIDNPIELF